MEDSRARFKATLIDSQIDTLEILAAGGTLTPDHAEARAYELAQDGGLSEQQEARLARIVKLTTERAGFSVN